MTPTEQAEQRARDYVRDRGWRQEPLSWEEVAKLLEAHGLITWSDECRCPCTGACAS